jgi:hypothetical protein
MQKARALEVHEGDPSLDVPLAQFIDRLRRALATPAAAAAVAPAPIVVRIDLTDVEGPPVMLRLDRSPPEVYLGTPDVSPDVRLWMSFADLVSTFSDGSFLPMEILGGGVRFEGMVRKFLRVLPGLRDAVTKTGS